jgi:uncharacterized membrane protein
VYGLTIGGLAFLNTWDGPVYLVLLAAAEALRRLMRGGGRLRARDWLQVAGFAFQLGLLALVLYLPFWFGFRSQAGGLLPNIIQPTTPQQFFLMFGPFILLLAPFVALEAWRAGERMNWVTALGTIALVVLLAFGLLVLFAGLAWAVPAARATALRYIEDAGGWNAVMPVVLERRLWALPTLLLLVIGVGLVVGRLFPRVGRKPWDADNEATADENLGVTYPPATGFALLLVGLGLALTLVPEFIYLRDNFGTRMNTIFKFYYQAWLVWGVASAYAVYSVVADARPTALSPTERYEAGGAMRTGYGALTAVVLALGLLYPVLGVYSRALVETGRLGVPTPPPLTLDGGTSFASADDYQAILCLNRLVEGDDVVAVEAIGPAYRNEYGRVAALTGVPILLGWENHQRQWRGATYDEIAATRPVDIVRLYENPRWDIAQGIINTYGIDYIFYGASERNSYGAAGEEKFRDNLEVVCEVGSSRFYRANPTQVAGN